MFGSDIEELHTLAKCTQINVSVAHNDRESQKNNEFKDMDTDDRGKKEIG
jgi:hypothetical protein